MSEYKNFEYDFIKRTLNILENYAGEYEITSLINNCIGLLILPKASFELKLPTDILSDNIKIYGITRKNINFIRHEKMEIRFDNYDEYNIRNVVTHMRNAIAHGHIEQESIEHGQIKNLCFRDENNNSKQETFKAIFSINEFKEFAVLIAKKVLESKPKE